MPRLPVYLDNNATTALDSRVLDVMLPLFTDTYGNAASTGHCVGRMAKVAVENARQSIAQSIGAADAQEIVFTSGATESDNLAVKGVAEALQSKGNHIITCKTEHKAVLDTCAYLATRGFEITYLDVQPDGLVPIEWVANAITNKTILVTIMAANNEIGVLQDVAEIGTLCRDRGVIFHTDSTQAIGKVPFNVQSMNVDLASITAHKIYGPKGAGALYVRKHPSIQVAPQQHGGGHEQGYRSGTLNVTGIVGLAKAIAICLEEQTFEMQRLAFLRNRFFDGLNIAVGGIKLNGHAEKRLPGHLSIQMEGVEGASLLAGLPELAASTVSACSTGAEGPSHVLCAIGLTEREALSTLRIGLGRFNTEEEVDFAVDRLAEAIQKQRTRSNPFAP